MRINVEKSRGNIIVDDKGKHLIDCFTQYSSQSLSWNHPKLNAYESYFGRVALHKLANSDIDSVEKDKFLNKLDSIFSKCFGNRLYVYNKLYYLIDNGYAGVENSIKLAFDWKARQSFNIYNTGEERDERELHELAQKFCVVGLNPCFHGRGLATGTLTTNFQKVKLFPKFNWPRISLDGWEPCYQTNLKRSEKRALDELYSFTKFKMIAAVIIEPISCESGDIHHSDEFLLSIQDICSKNDIIYIADEVQTFASTGDWFYNKYADISCFGKKIQTAGFGLSNPYKIHKVKNNVFEQESRLDSTFGGNIVDFARFNIIYNIIQEDNLLAHSQLVCEGFLDELGTVNGISNVRGKGVLIAFDVDKEKRNEIYNRLNENVCCLTCGDRTIRLRPSLDFDINLIPAVAKYVRKALI